MSRIPQLPYTRGGKKLLRRMPQNPSLIGEYLCELYPRIGIAGEGQQKRLTRGRISWAVTFLTVPPRGDLSNPILIGRLTEQRWKRALAFEASAP